MFVPLSSFLLNRNSRRRLVRHKLMIAGPFDSQGRLFWWLKLFLRLEFFETEMKAWKEIFDWNRICFRRIQAVRLLNDKG